MKELYRQMNEQINPSPALVERAVHASDTPAPARLHLKWVPLMALCLAMVVAMPALAATNMEFNALLYRIFPDVALYFRPVNLVSEDNGITVTVLAVDVDGPKAELYVAVSGEGVDETIDFFDSYTLDRPSDTSAGCRLAAYDEATNTAVFHIDYRLMDGSDIAASSKVTFSVQRMLRNKQEQTVAVVKGSELPLDEAQTIPAEVGLNGLGINGWSGTGTDDHCPTDKIMTPGQANIPIVDGLTITAAGVVDGQYRVQVHMKDNLRTDNHAFLYLVDEEGHIVRDGLGRGFGVWFSQLDENGVRQRYDETVFPIAPEELAEYTLWANTVTADPAIEGDWSITFPIVDYEKE